MRRSFEDYADLIREWEKAQEELKNLAAIVEAVVGLVALEGGCTMTGLESPAVLAARHEVVRLLRLRAGGPLSAGYVCKRCGGPAPVGVGYVSTAPGAEVRSAMVDACPCGYSVAPERLEDVTATAVRLSDQVHAVRNVIRKWEPSGTAIAGYICADLREIVLKEDDDA